MRLLIFASAFLFAQVALQNPKPPEQSKKSESAGQEINTQVQTLPSLPNPISGTTATPPSNPEQTNTANSYDGPHHSITFLNAISTLAIAIFSFLTWRVYRAQLHATKITERAWLVPDITSMTKTKIKGTLQVVCEIRNNGHTPAWVTAAGSVGLVRTDEKHLPEMPPYTDMGPFPKSGSLMPPTASIAQGFPLTNDQLIGVAKGEQLLYIAGFIEYLDIYKSKHRSCYCYQLKRAQDLTSTSPLDFSIGGPPQYNSAD